MLSGITPAELQQSAFAPLDLPEIQSLKNLDPVAAAREVARLLAPLKSALRDTPQRVVEEKLASRLRPAGDRALTRLVSRLRQDLGGWEPNVDTAALAAMLLIQAPYDKLPEALKELAGTSLSTDDLRAVIDNLECFWVDPEAAAILTTTARAPVATRAALLNAQDAEFTPKAYIARVALIHFRGQVSYAIRSGREPKRQSHLAQAEERP